jgi:hypothetical protein
MRSVEEDKQTYWKGLFELARRLKALVSSEDRATLRAAVALWVRVAGGRGIEVTGFDAAWATFQEKWKTVEVPFGAAWAAVVRRRDDVPVPPQIGGKNRRAVARVMIALAEEHRRRGRVAFYAACRDIAAAAGVARSTAHRALRELVDLGYLRPVQPGQSGVRRLGKATVWSWAPTPDPPEDSMDGNPPPITRAESCRPASEGYLEW